MYVRTYVHTHTHTRVRTRTHTHTHTHLHTNPTSVTDCQSSLWTTYDARKAIRESPFWGQSCMHTDCWLANIGPNPFWNKTVYGPNPFWNKTHFCVAFLTTFQWEFFPRLFWQIELLKIYRLSQKHQLSWKMDLTPFGKELFIWCLFTIYNIITLFLVTYSQNYSHIPCFKLNSL